MTPPRDAQFRGVGVDLVAVERVTVARQRTESFTREMFTDVERDHAYSGGEHPDRRFAGRWAAKEAVVKALGCGANVVRFSDVEIAASDSGAPVVNLYGTAAERAAQLGVTGVQVSITHDKQHAAAAAVAYRQPDRPSPPVDGADPDDRAWNRLGVDRDTWERLGLTPTEVAAYMTYGVVDPDEAARIEAGGGIDAVIHRRSAVAAEMTDS